MPFIWMAAESPIILVCAATKHIIEVQCQIKAEAVNNWASVKSTVQAFGLKNQFELIFLFSSPQSEIILIKVLQRNLQRSSWGENSNLIIRSSIL